MTSFEVGDIIEYHHEARQYRYMNGTRGEVLEVKPVFEDEETLYKYSILWDDPIPADLHATRDYFHHVLKYVSAGAARIKEPDENIYNDLI